jgi:hypothetical protein
MRNPGPKAYQQTDVDISAEPDPEYLTILLGGVDKMIDV